MTSDVSPDPSKIGVIPQPPLAMLPDPVRVFARRAERLRFLAGSSRLAPYLRFLAGIADVQAALAAEAPRPAPLPEARVALARESRMPPIDRSRLAEDPGLGALFDRLLDAAAPVEKPEAAEATRLAVRAADPETRAWLLGNVLADAIPPEEAGPHLYAAAAVQVHAARLAAGLDADRLVPIGTGVCPCCGGRPVASLILGRPRLEGTRYAVCATCATLWNEVRVKCLACGSTKGIGYRALTEDAVIKAEVCDSCHRWVKVLYQAKDAGLDPVADDVASLGLDALMRDSAWRRAGFDPFLVGF